MHGKEEGKWHVDGTTILERHLEGHRWKLPRVVQKTNGTHNVHRKLNETLFKYKMVETKLQSAPSASVWACRIFLYTVILTFSATIIGLDGRKADNIWNDDLFYDSTSIDFCAYSASSVKEGGDHGACRYVMALASISLILVFFLWISTFVDALYPLLTKFWFVELGINVFQTLWWLTGAIVVTAKRPSSSVMDALHITKDINAIEGLSWINFAFSLFMCGLSIVDGVLIGTSDSPSGKGQSGANNA